MKRGFKILIFLVASLFVYLFLVEIVLAYNMPFAALIVALGFIAFFGLLNRKIEGFFLKPHNRFGLFALLFLIMYFMAGSNLRRAQEAYTAGHDTSIHLLALYNLERITASLLGLIFLIAYGASRLRNLSDKKNLLKQDISVVVTEGSGLPTAEDVVDAQQDSTGVEEETTTEHENPVPTPERGSNLEGGRRLTRRLTKHKNRFLSMMRQEESGFRCPDCYADVRKDQKYCSNCGVELDWN